MTEVTIDKPKSCFQLKGSLFTLTVIHLTEVNFELFEQQLRETVEKTPKFFHNAPVVIDLNALTGQEEIDFERLNSKLREQNLFPVGIRSGSSNQQNAALAAGLAILPNHHSHQAGNEDKNKTDKSPAVADVAEEPTVKGTATKVIYQPVRSGQQIYAKGGDLLVLSAVSAGAELLADGNIHVYGPLRGRALAGVNGDTSAHIFCKSLDAELVSIGGRYRVKEDIVVADEGKLVHVYLEEERLQIETL